MCFCVSERKDEDLCDSLPPPQQILFPLSFGTVLFCGKKEGDEIISGSACRTIFGFYFRYRRSTQKPFRLLQDYAHIIYVYNGITSFYRVLFFYVKSMEFFCQF